MKIYNDFDEFVQKGKELGFFHGDDELRLVRIKKLYSRYDVLNFFPKVLYYNTEYLTDIVESYTNLVTDLVKASKSLFNPENLIVEKFSIPVTENNKLIEIKKGKNSEFKREVLLENEKYYISKDKNEAIGVKIQFSINGKEYQCSFCQETKLIELKYLELVNQVFDDLNLEYKFYLDNEITDYTSIIIFMKQEQAKMLDEEKLLKVHLPKNIRREIIA